MITSHLEGANSAAGCLKGAYLIGANLKRARLYGAILVEADFTNANLQEANILGSCLQEATLTGAILKRACLKYAEPEGADVTVQQLAEAESLTGATLPDATKFSKDSWRAKFEKWRRKQEHATVSRP